MDHDPADVHETADSHDAHTSHHAHDMSGMAVGATLHCLTGCSIGEVIGMIIGTAAGWSNLPTTVLSIALSFVCGYSLSALPLVRGGIALATALGLVLAADTLSIVTMEVVDNLVMLVMPGALNAGLPNPIFWVSMALSLTIAFFAAWPVNRALLRRGKGHAITHHAMGEGTTMDNRPLIIGISAFLAGGFIASIGTLLG
jgi:hypothetical protein